MENRKIDHSQHPKYQNYDAALQKWKLAERLWFRIINNRATDLEKDAIRDHLNRARDIFGVLARSDFMSAASYMEKIQLMFEKLEKKQVYDGALACLASADKTENKFMKRTSYQEAERRFLGLGKFSCAEYFAKKAGQKYLETFTPSRVNSISFFQEPLIPTFHFRKPRQNQETEETCSELRILINGSYDLCIRAKLPSPTEELPTTTVITAAGAFQWNKGTQAYVCILKSESLRNLGLGAYVLRAKKLTSHEPRKSIRNDLTQEQWTRLDQALSEGGGNRLEVEDQAPEHFRIM
jgi:hypothetical protein